MRLLAAGLRSTPNGRRGGAAGHRRVDRRSGELVLAGMRADWDCKLTHIRHADEAEAEAESMQRRIVGSAIETMPAAGKRAAGALTVGT